MRNFTPLPVVLILVAIFCFPIVIPSGTEKIEKLDFNSHGLLVDTDNGLYDVSLDDVEICVNKEKDGNYFKFWQGWFGFNFFPQTVLKARLLVQDENQKQLWQK